MTTFENCGYGEDHNKKTVDTVTTTFENLTVSTVSNQGLHRIHSFQKWSSPYLQLSNVVFTVSTVFCDIHRINSFHRWSSPFPQFPTIIFTVSTVCNHGFHRIHSFQPWSTPYPQFSTMVFTVSIVFYCGHKRIHSFQKWFLHRIQSF